MRGPSGGERNFPKNNFEFISSLVCGCENLLHKIVLIGILLHFQRTMHFHSSSHFHFPLPWAWINRRLFKFIHVFFAFYFSPLNSRPKKELKLFFYFCYCSPQKFLERNSNSLSCRVVVRTSEPSRTPVDVNLVFYFGTIVKNTFLRFTICLRLKIVIYFRNIYSELFWYFLDINATRRKKCSKICWNFTFSRSAVLFFLHW